MSVIRVIDPYILFLFKKEFSSWLGILVRDNDIDNASLNSHLISGVTIELVTIILRAIAADKTAPNSTNQTHNHG
jgi:hypothetical protein